MINGVKVVVKKSIYHAGWCLKKHILIYVPEKHSGLTVLYLLLHELAHWKQALHIELHEFYREERLGDRSIDEQADIVTEVSADKYAFRMMSYLGINPAHVIKVLEADDFVISKRAKKGWVR
jgi:hypothetical protein